MDPAGWVLGHSCVDLCSWLAWEDTRMSLCARSRPLPLGEHPHAAVDLACLGSRVPRAVGSGPWQCLWVQEGNTGLSEISWVAVPTRVPERPPKAEMAWRPTRGEHYPGRGSAGQIGGRRLGHLQLASCSLFRQLCLSSFLLSHCDRKNKHSFALPTSAMG